MNAAMPLDKHGIVRTELKKEVGLLLGNGEMGGLGRNDGLGIDELWLSDYWRQPSPLRWSGPTFP